MGEYKLAVLGVSEARRNGNGTGREEDHKTVGGGRLSKKRGEVGMD
jgi:hypothetical protein